MDLIATYVKGGKVSGPGGPRADKVKARLSPGEFVIPADVVRRVGTHALDSLVAAFHKPAKGARKKGGFAEGGEVQPAAASGGEQSPGPIGRFVAGLTNSTPTFDANNVGMTLPGGDTAQYLKANTRDIGDAVSRGDVAGAVGTAARTAFTTPMVAGADVANTIGRNLPPAADVVSRFAAGLTNQTPVAEPKMTVSVSQPPRTAPAMEETSGIPAVQPGALKVTRDGNNVSITGDGPAPAPRLISAEARRLQLERAYAPTQYEPIPGAGNGPISSLSGSAGVDPEAFAQKVVAMQNVSPGASMGQAADAALNSKAYRKAYLAAMKEGTDLTRTVGQLGIEGFNAQTTRTNAQTNQLREGAYADLTKAQAAHQQATTQQLITQEAQRRQISDLQGQIANEADPAKRAALQRKLYAIQGKPQPKYQVVTQESMDQGMPTKTPYIVEDGENGPVVKPMSSYIPRVPLQQNPQAIAIANDPKLSRDEKVRQLRAMGYQ